jgi:hypothetical protein
MLVFQGLILIIDNYCNWYEKTVNWNMCSKCDRMCDHDEGAYIARAAKCTGSCLSLRWAKHGVNLRHYVRRTVFVTARCYRMLRWCTAVADMSHAREKISLLRGGEAHSEALEGD